MDVAEDDWCISTEEVKYAISDRTSAVLSVDIYGHPARSKELHEILAPRGVTQIADSAECFLGVDRRIEPTYAAASTYSFFGNKVITCGEGGCVATDDEVMASRIRQFKDQGNHATRRYWHEVVGYNYRLTNLQAAILLGQLKRADELLSMQQRVIDQLRFEYSA